MKHALAAALVFAAAGCVDRESTRVELTAGAPPGPNLVQFRAPPNMETASGLPHGALTSEATLVRADERATCVDLMLRGSWEPTADVALEVDGAPARMQKAALPECRVDGPCLPSDSHLARYPTDVSPNVTPRAARICFEGVPVARHVLVLRLRQGAFERQVEFDLDHRVAAR